MGELFDLLQGEVQSGDGVGDGTLENKHARVRKSAGSDENVSSCSKLAAPLEGCWWSGS